MQEGPREKEDLSSKPEDHPQVIHMTRNLSGIPEKRPPGLEAQARVSEGSKEALVRLFTGFYFRHCTNYLKYSNYYEILTSVSM